jgi:hypothetical protein
MYPSERPKGEFIGAYPSIRRHCCWCMGGVSFKDVKECPSLGCYLWPWRHGSGTKCKEELKKEGWVPTERGKEEEERAMEDEEDPEVV